MQVEQALEQLLAFSMHHGLLSKEDLPWARNLLLATLSLSQPMEVDAYQCYDDPLPPTVTPILESLCSYAIGKGLVQKDDQELYAAKIMGLVTPPPSVINERFVQIESRQGIDAATTWFYELCRANNYIKVDDIARNLCFQEPSPVGELILTINLSKPEKDPETIRREKETPASGYPKCQICVESTGYAGRANFPARQQHRMIPLCLDARAWHMQYSPYLYYAEHCIILNDRHAPMHMTEATFRAMFDFVDRFPHYFIGSNADLPIVGGSILSHDHFQGGKQVFPMTKAPIEIPLFCAEPLQAGIVDWPLSSLRLVSKDKETLLEKAQQLLHAWRLWSDPTCDILCKSDAPHNAITPVLRKDGDLYTLDLILRNNRTTQDHPLGIFHPHAELHHIKKENIGLIEAMGLFILPGRLLTELEQVKSALCQENEPAYPTNSSMAEHLPWIMHLRSKYGIVPPTDVDGMIQKELAIECSHVLMHCGVYDQTPTGRSGFLRFLSMIGYTKKDR